MLENQVGKEDIWENGLSGAAARTGKVRKQQVKQQNKYNWKEVFLKQNTKQDRKRP